MSSPATGTSTTRQESFLEGSISSDNDDSGHSVSYIIGAILLAVFVTCAFVLTCCHVKGSMRTDKVPTLSPTQPRQSQHAPGEQSTTFIVAVDGTPELSGPATPEKHPFMHLGKGTTYCDGKEEFAGSTCECNEKILQEKPYAEFGAFGSWVGSTEWVAARASRKIRLAEVLQTSVIGRNTNSCIKEHQANPPAKCDVSPPSTSPLELPPLVNMIQVEGSEMVAKANADVHQCLQNTVAEDIELRKRRFKTLCSRWHPDKNSPADAIFATEVFQYLQTQKAWYLGHLTDSASIP
jgi:hypothetical protein